VRERGRELISKRSSGGHPPPLECDGHTYLRTSYWFGGNMQQAQSLATVVRVIQSAAPLTVARAWKRAVQTRSALVTCPSRSALKSRGNAFSEMCIRTAIRHVPGEQRETCATPPNRSPRPENDAPAITSCDPSEILTRRNHACTHGYR
jgi:hypothetical protein